MEVVVVKEVEVERITSQAAVPSPEKEVPFSPLLSLAPYRTFQLVPYFTLAHACTTRKYLKLNQIPLRR